MPTCEGDAVHFHIKSDLLRITLISFVNLSHLFLTTEVISILGTYAGIQL